MTELHNSLQHILGVQGLNVEIQPGSSADLSKVKLTWEPQWMPPYKDRLDIASETLSGLKRIGIYLESEVIGDMTPYYAAFEKNIAGEATIGTDLIVFEIDSSLLKKKITSRIQESEAQAQREAAEKSIRRHYTVIQSALASYAESVVDYDTSDYSVPPVRAQIEDRTISFSTWYHEGDGLVAGNTVLGELAIRLLQQGVMDYKPKQQVGHSSERIFNGQVIRDVPFDKALNAVYMLTRDPEVHELIQERQQKNTR